MPALTFDFPPADVEIEIVASESGLSKDLCAGLVNLAQRIRALKGQDLEEGVSTRLLVYCASLVTDGMSIKQAVRHTLIEPLSDDADVIAALEELAGHAFRLTARSMTAWYEFEELVGLALASLGRLSNQLSDISRG